LEPVSRVPCLDHAHFAGWIGVAMSSSERIGDCFSW
jgi:hypothetical protein